MAARFRLDKPFRCSLLCNSALVPAAALLGVTSSAFAQAVNLGGQSPGNLIVPDGRTATTVSVHGSVTSVRTSTFAGGNAYNSFSTFSEAQGNTVNLYVPKQAHKLVNIVRNGAVNIQGTLNAYQNDKIGGNVVFADSYGFIVGKSGAINVGSLSVVTPSGATLDQIVDKNGHVNTDLATRVIAGNVPLSADGSVVIEGRINAAHFVRITAQDVRVAGSMAEAKKVAMRRAQFESTVNTQGLSEGGAIVVHNGSISIAAARDATIGGHLTANGTARHAGTISVAAAHNVTIEAAGRLTASATLASTKGRSQAAKHVAVASAPAAPAITISAGEAATIAGTLTASTSATALAGEIGITGADISVAATAQLIAKGVAAIDGGHIFVKSTATTTVQAGARFIANAVGTGNGGFVEISGKTDIVDPKIDVELGAAAASAHAGTILFDPDDLIIGGTAQLPAPGDNATVSSAGSLYTRGANVELDANNSITINGVIDTRQYASAMAPSPNYVSGLLAATGTAATGNAGSITLKAPIVTVASGGALYADVYNATVNGTTTTWTPGAIVLGGGIGQTIAINGTVTGGAITANATGTISLSGSVFGGPTTFTAGATITLGTTGVIDTRALDPTGTFSIADSQSIALIAPTITTANASQIRSGVVNASTTTFVPGAITLDASAVSNGSIDAAGVASGGTTVLRAGSSITLEASAAVDTRSLDPTAAISTADAQSVTLSAPTIALAAGSRILAAAINTSDTAFLPATISLDATSSPGGAIVAGGMLSGGTISLAAGSSIALGAMADLSTPNATGPNFGTVSLAAPTVSVTPGAQINALTVAYQLRQAAVVIGDAAMDSADASAPGFVSNTAIAAAIGAVTSGTFEITASGSITIDPQGVVTATPTTAVALSAPTITLSGGSQLGGGAVSLTAQTINIDAASSGGSTVTASTLNFAATTINLTSTADVIVGDATQDVNKAAAGFISNQTIATYVSAMAGTGLLQVSGTSSITLDPSGIIDGRQLSGGIAVGNALSLVLSTTLADWC